MFDQLRGTSVFSKLIFQDEYHQLKMKREDTPKIDFQMILGIANFG